MTYWNYDMRDKIDQRWDAILQKTFPDSTKWGAAVYFYDGKLELIEINKISDYSVNKSTWTHYAQILFTDDNTWEVHQLFKGEKENEMWIYCYYKKFADAAKLIASGRLDNMKPIKIYE